MNTDDRPPSQTYETSHPAPAGPWVFTHDGDQRLARVSGHGRAQLDLVDGSLHVGIAPDGSPSIVINSSSLETVATLRLPKPKPADVPSSEWAALFAKMFAIETPATPAEAELAIAELFAEAGSFGSFYQKASPTLRLRALIEHARVVSECVQMLDAQLGTGIESELGNEEIRDELRSRFRVLATMAAGRGDWSADLLAAMRDELDDDDHSLQAEIIRARTRWIPTAEGAAVGLGFEALPLGRDGHRAWAVEVASGVLVRVDNSAGEPAAMHFVAGETLVSMRQRFGSIDPK